MQTTTFTSRNYILSAGGRLYIELEGSVTRGFTPKIVGEARSFGSGPVESCCSECATELSESATYALSDDDSKAYIECEVCGNKYRIRMESIFCVAVRNGSSFDLVAVEAPNLKAAEAKVQGAGYKLSGATSYQIDAYGARFCAMRF